MTQTYTLEQLEAMKRDGLEVPADDDDEDEDTGPGKPLEPDAAAAPVDYEKARKELRREAGRHEDALKRIMGDDFAMFEECEMCDTLGYHPIQERGPQLEVDDTVEVCDRCRGLGKLATGSLVPEQASKPCGKCQGSGWNAKLTGQTTAAGVTPLAEVAAPWVPDGWQAVRVEQPSP